MTIKEEIKGERIAKVIARSGICSRREAEELITEGRVMVNGVIVHKPRGYITTSKDPGGRETIFDILPKHLPRVITVGRLDINTEGLLILTNDGEASRYMELPKTAWNRTYRARVHGIVDMERLKKLEKGIRIDGVAYGSIKVEMEQERDFNSWLSVSLSEGKNREIKKVFEYFGLQVNRLIRTSFGPFQLGNLPVGAVKEVPANVAKEALENLLIK